MEGLVPIPFTPSRSSSSSPKRKWTFVKYGKKKIKSKNGRGKFYRDYFKCNFQGCRVRGQLDRFFGEDSVLRREEFRIVSSIQQHNHGNDDVIHFSREQPRDDRPSQDASEQETYNSIQIDEPDSSMNVDVPATPEKSSEDDRLSMECALMVKEANRILDGSKRPEEDDDFDRYSIIYPYSR